jgi:hypothetical protein
MKKALVILVTIISMNINAAEVLAPASSNQETILPKRSLKDPRYRVQRQQSYEEQHLGEPQNDGLINLQKQRRKTVSN